MNFAIFGLLGTSSMRKKLNLWRVQARSAVHETRAPHPGAVKAHQPRHQHPTPRPREPGLGSSSSKGLRGLRNGDTHPQEDERCWSPETKVFQSGQCCLDSNPWINGLNPVSTSSRFCPVRNTQITMVTAVFIFLSRWRLLLL